MTRLLISVRNASEARAALRGGADLIDVKEPAQGSLGFAGEQSVAEVVREIAGRAAVSAALGELREWTEQGHVPSLAGVDYVKLGLAGCADDAGWPDRWRQLLGSLPPSTKPVAVVYADWQAARSPESEEIIQEAARNRCAAVLVDTFEKTGKTLLDCWPPAAVQEFVGQVRRQGMLVVLAGSLTVEGIARVLPLAPDFVAVRGAACEGGRTGPVCESRVRGLATLLNPPQSGKLAENA